MRKLILSTVALFALAGAAQAQSFPTGSVSGEFDYTKTYTNFDRLTNTQTHNQYNGFQGFTSAEHGSKIAVKSNYSGSVSGSTVNNSTANFAGNEGRLNGTVTVLGFPIGVSGALRTLGANSNSYSSGALTAASANGGSASGSTAGYAAGGAGARNETGWTNSQASDRQWGNSQNWNGSGSLSIAR